MDTLLSMYMSLFLKQFCTLLIKAGTSVTIKEIIIPDILDMGCVSCLAIYWHEVASFVCCVRGSWHLCETSKGLSTTTVSNLGKLSQYSVRHTYNNISVICTFSILEVYLRKQCHPCQNTKVLILLREEN